MGQFEQSVYELMSSLKAQMRVMPIILGGVNGSGGGGGGPPGGFVGVLPQTRVAYDSTEAEDTGTTVSGSLLDNLNHIRYRIGVLETSAPGSGTGAEYLNDLLDVIITSPADTQVLKYDSGTSKWINAAEAAGASALDDLTDVVITSPADNQVLKYDTATSKWINDDSPAGASALDDLTDVVITSVQDNQFLRYDNGTSKWINETVTISGGGSEGDYQTVWSPRAKPASAHAKDDEFPTGALNGAWTVFDPGSAIDSYAVGNLGLKMVASIVNTAKIAGIFKTTPGSEFSITTQVHPNHKTSDYNKFGIGLFADATNNPTTCKVYMASMSIGTYQYARQCEGWDNYDGAYSYSDLSSEGDGLHPFIRVRVNGTGIEVDYSMDGIAWLTYVSGGTLAFTPAEIGLFLECNAGDRNPFAYFSYFRVTDSAAFDQVMSGNNIKLYIA